MKSHSNAEAAANLLRCSTAGVSGGRVSKHNASYRDAVSEEMQMYFSKLKELVPFMPKNKKLSKLEIIQYVIDYICDLQLALETQPRSPNSAAPNNNAAVAVAAAAAAAAAAGSSSPSVSPTRQPLGVIAAPNTLPNTCAAQEATHLDKVPSHLDDLGTRPVSC